MDNKIQEFEELGGDTALLADLITQEAQADLERERAVAFKAETPAEPEAKPEAEPEPEAAAEPEDEAEPEEEGDDTTLTEGDLVAVKALLDGILAPILKTLTAQKANAPDPRIVELERRLSALEGLSPSSTSRPSRDAGNVGIAEGLKGREPADDPWAAPMAAIFGQQA